jgi:hypothetical protein
VDDFSLIGSLSFSLRSSNPISTPLPSLVTSALQMKRECFSEILASTYETTWRSNVRHHQQKQVTLRRCVCECMFALIKKSGSIQSLLMITGSVILLKCPSRTTGKFKAVNTQSHINIIPQGPKSLNNDQPTNTDCIHTCY